MKVSKVLSGGLHRLTALALAGGTLWAVAVTAGSGTLDAAVTALGTALSSPVNALRWELGDVWVDDTLSPATALTIAESPLLLSARLAVAELWSSEVADTPPDSGQAPPPITTPVEETPLDSLNLTDNGVPARTLVPTTASGYTVCGKAYINNTTSYPLSIPELAEPFAAELTAEEPQILILHTHGSEAYTPPAGTDIVYTGDHRSTDARYNVVRVGDEMAKAFGEAGLSVLHDRTLYDYPSYAGSYDRSLQAIQSYLAQYPSLRFILDVHRDAIADAQGNEYKVLAQVDGDSIAQMTLVMGSSGGGLKHEQWKENLKLAVALQSDLLGQYPTLMRPILLRNSRYNQHATTGSLLVEVGAAGNSPDEAALAGRLFAQRMAEVLEARSK
ncbi:MAG: stage II sporulation protein P [Oscillibacter sp.]